MAHERPEWHKRSASAAERKPRIDHRKREQQRVFIRQGFAKSPGLGPVAPFDSTAQQDDARIETLFTGGFELLRELVAQPFIAGKQRQAKSALPEDAIVRAGLQRELELMRRQIGRAHV